MAVKFWTNVDIDIQSALATAQTITAISQANPGVVTHNGASLTDGDYVALTVNGMSELTNRVARANNPSASPSEFEIEGVDTSEYGAFTSGSFQEITFGTSLSTITSITTSGGEPEFEDTSVIHNDIRTQAPTVTSPFTVTMESIWDPSDAGLVALKAASDAKTTRAVRITFADGSKVAFIAYVSCTMIPTGSFPGKVVTNVTLTSAGLPDNWSS
jgi:hypothetical protein